MTVRQTADRAFDAFRRGLGGDRAAIDEFVAMVEDDAVLAFPPLPHMPSTYRGPEEARAIFEGVWSRIPDGLELTPVFALEDEHRVAYQFADRGQRADGSWYRNSVTITLEIRDGKVSRLWEFLGGPGYYTAPMAPSHDRSGVTAIRAVCWDMDGLMVDSEPLHFEAMRRVLARRGHTYTLEDKLAVTGGVVRESVHRAAEKYGLTDTDEMYRERVAIFQQLIESELQLRPGVVDLLKRLKSRQIRCAVVTSAERDYLAWTLAQFSIGHYFVATVSADDGARHKPDPDPYLRAAEKLRVPAATCLALEDSRTGLLAAKAAGMACLAVPNTMTMHQDFALADGLYDSLQDIDDRELDRLLAGGPQ